MSEYFFKLAIEIDLGAERATEAVALLVDIDEQLAAIEIDLPRVPRFPETAEFVETHGRGIATSGLRAYVVDGFLEICERDEVAEVQLAAAFVQLLLRRFELDEPVAFSHAFANANDYGGGAAFVTRDRILMFDTDDWIQRMKAAAAAGIRGPGFAIDRKQVGELFRKAADALEGRADEMDAPDGP